MDDTNLQRRIFLGSSYNSVLTEVLDSWAPQLQRRGTEDDMETVQRCKTFVHNISCNLEAAMKEADK